MNSPQTILSLLALIFTVLSFVRPTWPLLQVAVLLLCIVMMLGHR